MNRLCSLLIAAAVVCLLATAASAGGTLKIAGSTTVLPLSQIWAEEYMAKNPSVSISVSGGGSGTGLSMLLNGTCDLANASRAAKKKEIDAGKARNMRLVATKLAKDGLAIIVHPTNNVKNLTMAQLASIYSGKIQNWNEVGGDSKKAIVVVGRDSASGTYGFFQEAVLANGAYRKDMLALPSNKSVQQAVIQSPDAVGYVGMHYADSPKLAVVSVSRKKGEAGLKPTKETVQNGTYPLFRYLYAYTLGSPKGLAGAFLKWCMGPQGQAMVETGGYLPLN